MKAKNLKTLKKLLELNGEEAVLDKLLEEATELSLALIQLKCPTKLDKKKRLNDVYKEFADLKNVMRQAEMFLNSRKINRLSNAKIEKKRIKYLTNEKKKRPNINVQQKKKSKNTA
jgi:hypothetical protein